MPDELFWHYFCQGHNTRTKASGGFTQLLKMIILMYLGVLKLLYALEPLFLSLKKL